MSYSQIRRGPMGGDHFTQIHNLVFRDIRLSAKAMGVFGHLSTHEPGWETSAKAIARNMRDGEDAIKGALRELEYYHYLVRGQERLPSGRQGRGWLFLTDLPAQLAQHGITDSDVVTQSVQSALESWMQQTSRSQPREEDPQPGRENPPPGMTSDDAEQVEPDTEPVDNSARNTGIEEDRPSAAPRGDFPPAVFPPAVNPATKNTKDQKTKRQNTKAAAAPTPPPSELGCPEQEPGHVESVVTTQNELASNPPPAREGSDSMSSNDGTQHDDSAGEDGRSPAQREALAQVRQAVGRRRSSKDCESWAEVAADGNVRIDFEPFPVSTGPPPF